jgi:aldehyde dehydrogenase (NAD+)
MDDADLDLALEAVLWSAFGTSGQRCTAASRIIVHRDVHDRFRDMLVARAERMRLGHGLDPETDIGPVINRKALEKIHSYTAVAREAGNKILTGGAIHENGGGFFYKPTVFDDVKPGDRVGQEEIFGPCVSLITAGSLEEAIEINNGVAYGLSSSIFTQDVNRAFRAIRDLSSGLCYINHGTIGAEIQLPFGGTGATGNGAREAGQAALDTFTEWKAVYVDWSGRLQRAQIDTHD